MTYQLTSCNLSYHYQEFVNLTRSSIMQLGRMAWMLPDQFKQEIEAREVSRKTLLVPDLSGEPLQIKIINNEEHVFLNCLV